MNCTHHLQLTACLVSLTLFLSCNKKNEIEDIDKAESVNKEIIVDSSALHHISTNLKISETNSLPNGTINKIIKNDTAEFKLRNHLGSSISNSITKIGIDFPYCRGLEDQRSIEAITLSYSQTLASKRIKQLISASLIKDTNLPSVLEEKSKAYEEDSINTAGTHTPTTVPHISSDKDLSGLFIHGMYFYCKKLGDIDLIIDKKNINDILIYKTDLFENIENDEIPLSPEQFLEIHGRQYCQSITIGTACLAEIDIFLQNRTEISDAVINEAQSLLSQMTKNGVSWESIKSNSTYFKDATLIISLQTFVPAAFSKCNSFTTIKSAVENSFSNSEIGVIARDFENYSFLYPNFPFIQ